jgi:hypothetical protein
VRTERRWYVPDALDTWVPESAQARYEEVTDSGWYLDEAVPRPNQRRREYWTGVILEVDLDPSG